MSSRNDRLRHIWRTVFGDSEEFIDFYFSRRAPLAETFTSEQDGLIVAQAQGFLYKAEVGIVGYLSGLATLPQYRRQGHAANIMRQLHHWLRSKGAAYSLLIPADQAAAQWYAKHFGYREVKGGSAPTLRTLMEDLPLRAEGVFEGLYLPICATAPLPSPLHVSLTMERVGTGSSL